MTKEQAEPVAWRIFDGEGGYDYSDDAPSEEQIKWSARWSRRHEPLYLHPPAAEDDEDAGQLLIALSETIKLRDAAWAENDQLRDALKPFAAIDLTTNQAVDAMDVLRARSALKGSDAQQP